MKQNQVKPLASPRSKIQLKSPPTRPKLKISSPIHSPKSTLTKPSSNKKIQQKQPSKLLVWLPNSTMYSLIHPLSRLDTISLNFQLQITKNNADKKKIWIISAIDAFIQTYMELNDQMKVQCEKWYVISNAVNSKQTQKQFNQLYSPINFVFLPGISSICNQLLNYTSNQSFRIVQMIYDLSLASASQFFCIQQTLMQNMHAPRANCLYIISDAKQWMHFSTKIPTTLYPYFLTGTQQFKNNKISTKLPPINIANQQKYQIFYILFQFQKNIQQIPGFLQYQSNYKRQMLSNKSKLSQKISKKNQVYVSKVIEKLLIPQKRICIFVEPLSKSCLLQLSQIRDKFKKQYILLQASFYKQADNCYRLKWNSRTKSCQQFSINTAMIIIDQIKRIEMFINDKQSLGELYHKHTDKLKKMQIYMYQKDNLLQDDSNNQDQKRHKNKQKNNKHCITSALERNSIKIGIIQNLQFLYETHKITLIYGNFSFAQIKSVNKFYNVFLVPLAKQSQEIAAFNQIVQARTFIQVALNSFKQTYGQLQSQPLQSFVHVLYESETQLPQLLKPLNSPQQILKTHYIPSFHTQLQKFRQCSRHIIISKMQIFDQSIQQQIREYQWKYNTISIEIYLQYGQQYIFRNKQGVYKFIKLAQLQNKINQMEELYKKQNRVSVSNNGDKLGINRAGVDVAMDAGMGVNNRGVNADLQRQQLQLIKSQFTQQQLNNLIAEQSIVQCYVDNRSLIPKQKQFSIPKPPITTDKQKNLQYYNNSSGMFSNKIGALPQDTIKNNKNNESIIQILTDSAIRDQQASGKIVLNQHQLRIDPLNQNGKKSVRIGESNQLQYSNSTINILTSSNIQSPVETKMNQAKQEVVLANNDNDGHLATSMHKIAQDNQYNYQKHRNYYADNNSNNKITSKNKIIKITQVTQPNRQKNGSTSKNKKPREKSTYIKQYKQYQHTPIKINEKHVSPAVISQINSKQDITFQGQGGEQQEISSPMELYKLFIFIHRSVPYHSLLSRSQKQYHILLYTRLEEILVFACYLKSQERIVVIANQQSSKIYSQLIQKAKVDQGKFRIVFNRDLSQNYIRYQVDKILAQENLQENKQQDKISKKFKALIVYSSQNQRVTKALKIVKKIFGIQLKPLLLKQKQYDQMIQSKYNLSLSSDTKIFKLGIAPKANSKYPQQSITSIRSIFILAMHPDLKSFSFQFKELEFSLESYLGRIVYGGSDKDYCFTGKRKDVNLNINLSPADTLRKKIKSIKSQKNLFRESGYSKLKSQGSQRMRNQSLLRSNISRASTTALFRSSTTSTLIVSSTLKQQITSKHIFSTQLNLYSHILQSHSNSKLAIVVLTQKQFDTFEIFQFPNFDQISKQIIWIIETKVQGKQLFVGNNIVYTLIDNVKESVEKVMKEYQLQMHFDCLVIQGKMDGIKYGTYGERSNIKQQKYKSQNNRILHVKILTKAQQSDLSPSFNINSSLNNKKTNIANLKIILSQTKDQKITKKHPKNTIQFQLTEQIKHFCQILTHKFQPNIPHKEYKQQQIITNLGSLILIPHSQHIKINKCSQILMRRNLTFKIYDPTNSLTLLGYSVLRILIVLEKEKDKEKEKQEDLEIGEILNRCENVMEIDRSIEKDKLAKLVSAALL